MAKIVVGIDASERSGDAVALAAQLAGANAELVLVSAFPYDTSDVRGASAGYERALRSDALEAIAHAREGIELGDVTERAVPDISPARVLQTIAELEDAALIVIGSSHRGAIGRALVGTTAERLLHGAPCPVAVAPRGFRAGPIRTIAVGYDGTDEARAALAGATAMAGALGARLRLVKIVDPLMFGSAAMMGGAAYVVAPEELEQEARDNLAGVIATLPPGVVADAVGTVGEPEQVLAEHSASADLMVVGSRGYGPHRAVLLGSVSGRLVRDAACPVLVVPRGVPAPLAPLFGDVTAVQVA